MKMKALVSSAALAAMILTGTARAASDDVGRDKSDINKMLHKLGRGITNVFTCWVEIPRTVSREWERTDPVTGIVLGTVKGAGWAATRLATGAYETFTFPFPVPPDYKAMIEPEFVVTDVWGDGIPDITDLHSNDPVAKKGSAAGAPKRYQY